MVANADFADERPDYLHIRDRIVPMLLDAGVSREQIDTMVIDNPTRFFS